MVSVKCEIFLRLNASINTSVGTATAVTTTITFSSDNTTWSEEEETGKVSSVGEWDLLR